MSKSPAFQFYPKDWLSSQKISLMSAAEEGAYIRLLCYCWDDDDCALPDDDELLARISRLGEGWFNGGSTIIRKCFVAHPRKRGFLTNARLCAEKEKQRIWKEKSAEGGKRSGESRRNKALREVKGGSDLVEPNGNIAFASAFASSNKKTITHLRENHEAFAQTRFMDFWNIYPRKKDKLRAMKAWDKAKLDEQADFIISDVKKRIDLDAAWKNKQFIPHPSNYLNGERWNDEISETAESKITAKNEIRSTVPWFKPQHSNLKN